MAEPSSTAAAERLSAESQRYELTLGDYLRILTKRRLLVAACFVLVLAMSIVYTNMKTPLYSASSTVRITAAPRAFQAGSLYIPTTNFSTYDKAREAGKQINWALLSGLVE